MPWRTSRRVGSRLGPNRIAEIACHQCHSGSSGPGRAQAQLPASDLRAGRAESPVVTRPATSPPPPFGEPTVLKRSSAWRLLGLAKYSDFGSRARHAVPLQSEHGPCRHNRRDSVAHGGSRFDERWPLSSDFRFRNCLVSSIYCLSPGWIGVGKLNS